MLRIILVGTAASSLVLPAAAGERGGYRYEDPSAWNAGVGRNAGPAIAHGLAGMTNGWIATIDAAYADPYFRNADYFDYYRRRTYGAVRASRR